MISTKFAVFVATLTLIGVGSPLLVADQEIGGNNEMHQSGDISESQEACTNEQENDHHFSLVEVMLALGQLSQPSLGGQADFGDQTFDCEAVQNADATVNNDAAIVDES